MKQKKNVYTILYSFSSKDNKLCIDTAFSAFKILQKLPRSQKLTFITSKIFTNGKKKKKTCTQKKMCRKIYFCPYRLNNTEPQWTLKHFSKHLVLCSTGLEWYNYNIFPFWEGCNFRVMFSPIILYNLNVNSYYSLKFKYPKPSQSMLKESFKVYK